MVDIAEKYDYDYFAEADLLEIFFAGGPATSAVEIAEGITLRFRQEDREGSRAMSLILDNFTHLARRAEFGPLAFRLTGLEALPLEMRQSVQHLITSPPVSEFLKVISYVEPDGSAPIPLAYLEIPFTPQPRPVPELETAKASLATENTENL